MKKKWIFSSIIICFISILILIILLIPKDEPLTKKEIKKIVEEIYGGKLQTISLNRENNQYQVIIQKGSGNYQIAIDKKTGEILKLKKLNGKKQPDDRQQTSLLTLKEAKEFIEGQEGASIVSINDKTIENEAYYAYTVENQQEIYLLNRRTKEISILDDATEEKGIISSEQAKKIAREQVKGDIQEIDLEKDENQTFYEVELQAASNHNEVKILINAYSGEIISISWEED